MESDIARILTALVLALPGYFWWRKLRVSNPPAARRYVFGVGAMAVAVVAITVGVGLVMPDGGGAAIVAAIAALLLLSAAAVSAFLLWGLPPENRAGLSDRVLKQAMLLFAVAGTIAFAVTMAQSGTG